VWPHRRVVGGSCFGIGRGAARHQCLPRRQWPVVQPRIARSCPGSRRSSGVRPGIRRRTAPGAVRGAPGRRRAEREQRRQLGGVRRRDAAVQRRPLENAPPGLQSLPRRAAVPEPDGADGDGDGHGQRGGPARRRPPSAPGGRAGPRTGAGVLQDSDVRGPVHGAHRARAQARAARTTSPRTGRMSLSSWRATRCRISPSAHAMTARADALVSLAPRS
jgi:hypothetical protein